MSNQIHPTAIIEDSVKLGSNIKVDAYSVIRGNVTIGDGTTISTHVLIEGNTTIGKDNQIFSHSVIGSIPQDLKFDNEEVFLIIGDRNKIREHTLINPGTKGGGAKTVIGNDCLLMGHVHLGHDCIFGDNIVVANSTAVAGHVEVGNNAVIGGMSAIHQFCFIGEFAMIGGGSIVIQDIPPYTVCEGNRAVIKGINLNGLRRKFENREDINAIKNAYKELFRNENNPRDNASRLYDESDNEYVKKMCKFVVDTKRGIPFK
jgi:UDP-N-acetylglucosamine acyltransferase